ncbi:hypothetical protein ACFWAR_00440 [Streptomyces sp. NPDC059917]|uniref:hypothetical protein n=1 Tax=Streptomyces sp. NPDC059917 TaxID=3347002 RepID=UPI003659A1DD
MLHVIIFGMGRIRLDLEEVLRRTLAVGLQPVDIALYAGTGKPLELRCQKCQAVDSYRISDIGSRGCRHCTPREHKVRWTNETASARMAEARLRPLGPYPRRTDGVWPAECMDCGRVKPKLRFTQVLSGWRCPHVNPGKPQLSEEEVFADFAKAGLVMLGPYVNTTTAVEATCTGCDRTVSPRPAQIRRGERGCGPCGVKRRSATMMLDHAVAAAVMRRVNLVPREPYPGSETPWECDCLVCGAVARPRYANVQAGQGGRDSCRRIAQSLRQSVPSAKAEAVMRAAGLEPLEPYSGNGKDQWRCKCLNPKCGAITEPRYATVAATGSRCEICVPYGFLSYKPSVLYVLMHPEKGAVKVGITNTTARTDRLGRFMSEGWIVMKVFPFEVGRDARMAETLVKRQFKPYAGFLARGQMPNGGASETYPLAKVTVEDLCAAVDTAAGGAA